MKADLHMHSTASDGVHAPEEVVRLAHERGVQFMALTDHDSAEGVRAAQAAGERLGITVIPGVEMGCSTGNIKEIHILGYGIDPQDERLRAFCRAWRDKRNIRAEAMVAQLCAAGMPVSMERVRALAGDVIARPHVARALVEAGYARSVKEAFDKYLSPGRCGYVPRDKLSVQEAVQVIGSVGGVAVLAHPMQMRLSAMNIEALVHEWHGQGLAGIEVYHPSADNGDIQVLHALARREGMLVTGGSDFHGEAVRDNRIGQEVQRWTTWKDDVRALLDAIAAQRKGGAPCRA